MAVQVSKVEEDENALRSFVIDTRNNLQRGLHAVATMERLTNRLMDVGRHSGRTPAEQAEVLRLTYMELAISMDTIRTCFWKFLSTDI